MSNFQTVLKEVIPIISLNKEELESIENETKRIINQIKKSLKKKAEIVVGGSLAKRTLIKKEGQDVDIFIIFNDEESTKNLEKVLQKTKLNYEKIHGSRDYFQIKKEKLSFEIIPILKIKNKENVRNITEFSPYHVKYILKKIKKIKRIEKEIKLAKAFCSAQEVYGAESYIQGFSGYALEVLVCYYKSFRKFLEKIQKEDFIDPEKYFKNKKEAFREINQSKLISPLVLIDPVYKYRNVCAGLSKETFEKLKLSATKFLKNPSKDYFTKKEFDKEEFLKKTNTTKIILKIKTDKQKGDIAGTKMKKFFNFILVELKRKEQEVLNSKFLYEQDKNAEGYISLNTKKEIKIKGPAITLKEAVKSFRGKRKKIYFKKGFSWSKEIFSIEDFLEKQKEVAKSMKVSFEYKII